MNFYEIKEKFSDRSKIIEYNGESININYDNCSGLAIWEPLTNIEIDTQLKLFGESGCYQNKSLNDPHKKEHFKNQVNDGVNFLYSDRILSSLESLTLLEDLILDTYDAHLVFLNSGDFVEKGEILTRTQIEDLYFKKKDFFKKKYKTINIGFYQDNLPHETNQMEIIKFGKVKQENLFTTSTYNDFINFIKNHENLNIYVTCLSNLEDKKYEFLRELSTSTHTLYLKHHVGLNPSQTKWVLNGKDLLQTFENYRNFEAWKDLFGLQQLSPQEKMLNELTKEITNSRTKSNLEKVIELKALGRTQTEISEVTGISVPTLSRIYKKMNKIKI